MFVSRAGIQNGFWGFKYLLIIGGMIGSFWIPNDPFAQVHSIRIYFLSLSVFFTVSLSLSQSRCFTLSLSISLSFSFSVTHAHFNSLVFDV